MIAAGYLARGHVCPAAGPLSQHHIRAGYGRAGFIFLFPL